MAISRWTKARLQIVAVVTAIGVAAGIAISWLLSQILETRYDFAEFEQGARNGLTVGGAFATLDLFYVQGPRGAWLRRLSFAPGSIYRRRSASNRLGRSRCVAVSSRSHCTRSTRVSCRPQRPKALEPLGGRPCLTPRGPRSFGRLSASVRLP